MDYEQIRQKRIKENLERMRMIGISNISLHLKSACKSFPKLKAPHFTTTPLPLRRSPRLQHTDPVMYPKVAAPRSNNFSKSLYNSYLEVSSTPYVTTEEILHESSLSVDGYEQDGKRIYDSVKGRTCHQCRQKTLGHRTTCSKCNLLRGQFCGDCLYTRYGEKISEANQNPDWICPPCRGTCNCSICRRSKGLAPTGLLYRKIASLGFKSVAHYLSETVTPVRRPLPYADGAPSTDTESTKGLEQHSDRGIRRNQGHDVEKINVSCDMPIQDCNEMTARKDNFATGQMVEKVANETKQKSTDLGIKMTESKLEANLKIILQMNDLATKDSELKLCNKRSESADHLVFSEMPGQETINIITPVKTSGRKRGGGISIGPSSDSIAGRLKLRRGSRT